MVCRVRRSSQCWCGPSMRTEWVQAAVHSSWCRQCMYHGLSVGPGGVWLLRDPVQVREGWTANGGARTEGSGNVPEGSRSLWKPLESRTF
ncbi:hypothetical protein MRB53_019351 [Persea americana]|uniref:Uncharacterized protein n=1 Tax=Persea americana TaxID=3435 RepID=A0ACC2KXU4_PERAE|nr:hypothetical protein MRB53_019351 [Persea americana]